jgi:sigma-B regulation protein RsbU (phosphoserine phosphatase)
MELLETGGLLLGVMKNLTYERGEVELRPGDVLAMFTDGVTEAMSFDGEEYGEPRLEAMLKEHRQDSAKEIMDAVRADIARFTKGVSVLSDDLTMVIVKRI